MNILIVGDVFSKLGRESFERNLKNIKQEHKINFIIVNGENTSHGRGMNDKHFKWYMQQGVHVVTLGNHAYGNTTIFNYIDEVPNVVRPANFKEGSPGKGYIQIKYNGMSILVVQVLGRVFMNNESLECPFQTVESILQATPSDITICDMHAETTSEKIAFAHHFDGRMQVIYGTHTHVQTNDARILPKGTAYITDVGMTGALDGVIGVEKSIIIDRYLNQTAVRFAPQETGKTQFSAIFVEIDEQTKKAVLIKNIHIIE